MKKIKNWLIIRLLPMWAKETVFAENRQLQKEVIRLQEEIKRKDAYISGLMGGIRCQRRIIINTSEGKR